jgi:tRNA(adenine34) deaminase
MEDQYYMEEALRLAQDAQMKDEVPIGALIVRDGGMLGSGFNCNINTCDPTAHAEIMALRHAAAFVRNHRMPGATLFVTLEPCPMCFAALIQARIDRLVYGAPDPKGGFRQFFHREDMARFNHQIQIVDGVLEDRCSQLIRDFFKEKRQRGKRKWLADGNG